MRFITKPLAIRSLQWTTLYRGCDLHAPTRRTGPGAKVLCTRVINFSVESLNRERDAACDASDCSVRYSIPGGSCSSITFIGGVEKPSGLFGYLSLLIIVKWCTGSQADLYRVMIYIFLSPFDNLGEN
ncbi:uncharacterized protein LOC114915003 [Cajanus cajan]|uniref:uncharacterized protein LOC114915003 n=1 Tax=Cajanus cajan TaxID=3821 RepID=UPI0010FB9D5F|nr:uncharacterized protein LOC114915003 [Cajanus cajan]